MNTTSAATAATAGVAALPAPPAGPPASADVAPAATATAPAATATAPTDRLGAEVRESVLLLGLSVTVTAGLAAAAQALLSLLS